MGQGLLIYQNRINGLRYASVDNDRNAIRLGPVPQKMLDEARHLLLVQSLKGMNISDMQILARSRPRLFPAAVLLIHIHNRYGNKDKRCRFPTLLRARL